MAVHLGQNRIANVDDGGDSNFNVGFPFSGKVFSQDCVGRLS